MNDDYTQSNIKKYFEFTLGFCYSILGYNPSLQFSVSTNRNDICNYKSVNFFHEFDKLSDFSNNYFST